MIPRLFKLLAFYQVQEGQWIGGGEENQGKWAAIYPLIGYVLLIILHQYGEFNGRGRFCIFFLLLQLFRRRSSNSHSRMGLE